MFLLLKPAPTSCSSTDLIIYEYCIVNLSRTCVEHVKKIISIEVVQKWIARLDPERQTRIIKYNAAQISNIFFKRYLALAVKI